MSQMSQSVMSIVGYGSVLKAVFHSIISPPPAKNFDIEIFFLRSCVAEDTCSAGPVVENFHLLFDLTLTARKNN